MKRAKKIPDEIRSLRDELREMQEGLNALEQKEAHTTAELEKKRARFAEYKRNTQERLRELERQLRDEEGEEAAGKFIALAGELDRDGESPERIRQWFYLASTLRTAPRLGASHQLVTLTTDRLRALRRVTAH
jgi:predicted RNase H-like nuclease (RuvC/YqgF family)